MAGDCADIALVPEDFAYHIYPIHHGQCPGDGEAIRCHKYHWHWVCRKGDVLYWDRRLDTAARTACGCPPAAGAAPATPAVSPLPRDELIHSTGAPPVRD